MSDTGSILAALKRIEEKLDVLCARFEDSEPEVETNQFWRLEAAIERMHERAREKR